MEHNPTHITKEHSMGEFIPDAIPELQRYVEARAMNRGFGELYVISGGRELLPTDPRERLAKLYEFSQNGWNDRSDGKTRREADALAAQESQKRASEETEEDRQIRERKKELALEAGRKIGCMDASYPKDKDLDVGVVAGGSGTANKYRLAWLLENATPQISVMTCSGRKLPEKERQDVASFAPDAADEYELGVASAMAYFREREAKAGYQPGNHRIARNLGETMLPQENGDIWRATHILYWDENAGEYKDLLVSGSSDVLHDPDGNTYKPNTYSNLEWLVKGMDLRPGMKVGVSTTGLFVPEQDVAAQAVLASRGIDVSTFGYDAAYSGAVRTEAQIQRGASVTLERLYFLQTQLDALRIR